MLIDAGHPYGTTLAEMEQAGKEVEAKHTEFCKMAEMPLAKDLLELISSAKLPVSRLQLKLKLAATTIANHKPKEPKEAKANKGGQPQGLPISAPVS